MSTRKEALSPEHEQFLKKVKRRNLLITSLRWAILVLLIALWEVATRAGWLDPFIVSSPSRMVITAINLIREGNLFTHVGTTLLETIIGFTIGTALGTLIAVILWWSPVASRVLDPYLVVLNALPKVALGPVIIVWIGAGNGAIIFMALLVSIVVTIMGALGGFLETSPEKLMLMRTFGATKWQMLIKVVLPSNVPTLVSVLKINVGMSWVGVIVGEFLVSKQGLGYLIVYGGQVFKLDLVMTSVVILSIAAALMYQGVAAFERRMVRGKSG